METNESNDIYEMEEISDDEIIVKWQIKIKNERKYYKEYF